MKLGIGKTIYRKIQAEHIELLTPAVVLPYRSPMMIEQKPTVLGIGSVVYIHGTDHLEGNPPKSPVMTDRREIFVEWVSHSGIRSNGWLSTLTQYRVVKKGLAATRESTDRIPAWDIIRRKAFKVHMTVLDWIESRGDKFLPLLNGAIRELGGKSPKSDDAGSIKGRLARLIIQGGTTMARKTKQEVEDEDELEMEDQDEGDEGDESEEEDEVDEEGDEEEEEAPAPKKSKKDKKAKGKKEAKPAKEKAERAPAGKSVGDTLVKLLKGDTKTLATKLSNGGTLTAKQLEKLRDGINEEAAAAREADKGSLASQLSSANRLVRRLARAAAAAAE